MTFRSVRLGRGARRPFPLAVLAASAGLLLVAACGDAPETRPPAAEARERGNIVEVARVAGQFSTLLRAVEAAGLTQTLETGGPFTVFAPTDGAFAALPPGTLDALVEDPDGLADVLLYHVVPGELTVADLRERSSLETAQGTELTVEVTPQGVTIDGQYLLTADVRAANGIVHVITSVLVPGGE